MKILFFIFLPFIFLANDNQLFFKNGDILTAKIIKLNKKTITFKYKEKDFSIKFSNLNSIKITPELLKKIKKNQSNSFYLNKKSRLYFPSFKQKKFEKIQYNNSTNFSFGLNNSTGNNKNSGIHLNFENTYRNYYNTFKVYTDTSYKKNNEQTIINQSSLNFNFSHKLIHNLFNDIDIRFFRNTLNQLDLRTIYSIGINYKKIKKLDIGTNLSYINENYQIDTNNNQYLAAGLKFNYSTKIFSNTKISFKNLATFSSEKSKDILYTGKINLNIPIYSQISINFSIKINWNNNPIKNNSSTNSITQLSITFDL